MEAPRSLLLFCGMAGIIGLAAFGAAVHVSSDPPPPVVRPPQAIHQEELGERVRLLEQRITDLERSHDRLIDTACSMIASSVDAVSGELCKAVTSPLRTGTR